MRRWWIHLIAVLSLAALLSNARATGSARPAAAPPANVAVSIENYSFSPDPITVTVGTTVTWTNHDEVLHTVVSSDKLFSSPELEANQHFAFTFEKVGTFAYFCSIHPEMKGKVIVK